MGGQEEEGKGSEGGASREPNSTFLHDESRGDSCLSFAFVFLVTIWNEVASSALLCSSSSEKANASMGRPDVLNMLINASRLLFIFA